MESVGFGHATTVFSSSTAPARRELRS
jgi:hypothetical protein